VKKFFNSNTPFEKNIDKEELKEIKKSLLTFKNLIKYFFLNSLKNQRVFLLDFYLISCQKQIKKS
tara:strand:- start:698 stop:892 length:195 start_codon:yes stop_codon:yes gene_type:complete